MNKCLSRQMYRMGKVNWVFEVSGLTELGGVSLDTNCLIRKEEKGKREIRG